MLVWGFLSTLIVMYLFAHFKYLGGQRHASHLLMSMAAFYWLAQGQRIPRLSNLARRSLYILGGISMFSGVSLYATDFLYKFSEAKEVSQILSNTGDPVLVWPEALGPSVSAYLGGRTLIYMQGMREGSYIIYDKKTSGQKLPTMPELNNYFSSRGSRQFYFVTSNENVEPYLRNFFVVKNLYRTQHCMFRKNCYFLLQVGLNESSRP